MSIPQSYRMTCGCIATWNNRENQYVGNCTCPPEKHRAMRLAERKALQQERDKQKRRDESPLMRKPFRLLR